MGRADGQGQLAFVVKFTDAVGLALGTPDIVLSVDIDTVGILQHIFAPRIEKVAVTVKDHQRMFTARVNIDIVL